MTIRMPLGMLLTACLLLLPAAEGWCATEPASLPWKEGERFLSQWELVSTERHPEYVRLRLRAGETSTVVEIAGGDGKAGEWATPQYRVQPAPGESPPEELLKDILLRLAQVEKRAGDAAPFVAKMETADRAASPPERGRHLAGSEQGEHLLVLLLSLAFLFAAFLKALSATRSRCTPASLVRVLLTGAWLKFFLFWVLVLVPLYALTLVVAVVALQTHRINTRDWDRIVSDPAAMAAGRPGRPFSFETMGGQRGLTEDWADPPGPHFVPLSRSTGERLIYMFGESSLVYGNNVVFPKAVERRLNESPGAGFKVYNFGLGGAASNSVGNRVIESVREFPPDLIVIYTGHNDYAGVYYNHVQMYASMIESSALLYRLFSLYHRWIYTPFASSPPLSHPAYLRFIAEPGLLRLLQNWHVVHLRKEPFERLDGMVLEMYKANIRSIIDAAGARGIPMVLVTLIGNLEADPLGAGREAERHFRSGMSEKDYARRMAHLIRARDEDFFSGFVRAKSAMNDYLRSLGGGNLHVLDLEKAMFAREFRFGYGDFHDYVHLKDGTHNIIGDIIVDFIRERRVCCGLTADATPASGE
jgi:hypothetical protein